MEGEEWERKSNTSAAIRERIVSRSSSTKNMKYFHTL